MSKLGDRFAFWPIELAQPGHTDRWEILPSSAYVMSVYPSLDEHVDLPITQGSFPLTGHGFQTKEG